MCETLSHRKNKTKWRGEEELEEKETTKTTTTKYIEKTNKKHHIYNLYSKIDGRK